MPRDPTTPMTATAAAPFRPAPSPSGPSALPPSPLPTRRWTLVRRVAVAVVACVVATAAALGAFTHSSHFQHHTAQLLSDLAGAPGIALTVVARPGANLPAGTRLRGFFFPRHVATTTTTTTTTGLRGTDGSSSGQSADVAFDGRVSYEAEGVRFEFTLVDDRAFVTTTNVTSGALLTNDCLDAASVPPVHLLTDALRQGRVIDTVGGAFTVPCDDGDGKLVEFTFAGEPYVLCSRPTTGTRTEIHGEDLEATIEVFAQDTEGHPTRGELIRPGGKTIDECPTLVASDSDDVHKQATAKTTRGSMESHDPQQQKATPTPTPTTTASAATSSFMDHARARASKAAASVGASWSKLKTQSRDAWSVLWGQPREAATHDCATTCPTGKRACLFVHGLGEKTEAPLADAFESYWGDVHTRLPCCSTVKFLRMDTITKPWHDPSLARQVCAAARSLASPETRSPMALEGLAIIAHSMGNLITANAAMTHQCAIGKTSKWISLGSPMEGSQSANLGVRVCQADASSSRWDQAVFWALQKFNMCPAKGSMTSLVYRQSPESTARLDALSAQAEATRARYMTSSLCGVSSFGLATMYSAQYATLGRFSGHATADNDGVVEFGSCRGTRPESLYGTSWATGNYYRAALNHGDVTMANDDGWWGDDRKPLKWLQCQL